MSDRVALLCRRLEPLLPDQVKQLWAAYQTAPDITYRSQVEQMLEALAQQNLKLGYQPDRSPFVPPPSGWAEGGSLPVGEVVYAGRRHCDFNLELDRLAEHMLVCGRSGSGKSTLTLHLARGLMQRGVVVTAFDWKRSYRDLLRDAAPGTLRVRTPGRDLAPFFWNPLIPPPGMDHVLYAKLIVDVISRALLGGDGVISLLHRGILALYEREGVGTDNQHRWPTIHDLLEWLESTRLTGRAAMWKSSADRILRAMTYGEFGKMIDTQSNADLLALLDTNHVLELDGLAGSADRSIFAEGVTLWLYRYLLNRGERRHLERVWIHEEAHHLFSQAETGSTEGVLENSLRLCRAFGLGYIIVDQTASMLSKTVFSNTGTVFALSQKLRSDVQAIAGAMNLDDEQRQAVNTLPVGVAVARVADGYAEPFLVRIPPPEGQQHVTDEEVRHAASSTPAVETPIDTRTVEDEIAQLYFALRKRETTTQSPTPCGHVDSASACTDSGDSASIHTDQSLSEVITPIPPPEKITCKDLRSSEAIGYQELSSQDPGSESNPAGSVPSPEPKTDGIATLSTTIPAHPPNEEDSDPDLGGPDPPETPSATLATSTTAPRSDRPPSTPETDLSLAVSTDRLPAAMHGVAVTRFLGDLARHPLSTTVERYQRLKLSRRKGHGLRTALVEADLVRPLRLPTRSGNVVLMELTPRGRQHCASLGIEPPRTGSAGLAHRYWAKRVAESLADDGYKVRHEFYVEGNGRVDLLAENDDVVLPCEIETGRSHIVGNIRSAMKHFDKLLVVATCPDAVEQCSTLINKLPPAHQRRIMLKTWLDY